MAEGGRKKVPALTVKNILVALRGIERRWDDIGEQLCVPWKTREEIRSQHSIDSDRLRAVLLYALILHPRSSWRCLINALHWIREHQVAEQIQDYSEPVTDPTLTVEHVADVLSLLERNWYDIPPGGGRSLRWCLDVPLSMEEEIRRQHQSQLASVSAYIVQFIPGISWTVIAGALYYCCEERALQGAKEYIKSEKGPPGFREFEIKRKLNACQQAIKEKGAIDQIIMQGIFFGLPRSGKTSTKKRLVGKKPALKQTSTGVAEKVTRVEIEKSTVQFLSQYTWNEVTELNNETALVIEEIVDHAAANIREASDGATASISQTSTGDADQIQEDRKRQNQDAPKDGRIRIIVKKVKAVFKRKHRNISADQQSDIPPPQVSSTLDQHTEEIVAPAAQLQVLSTALQNSSIAIFQRSENQWTIYISDAGGQPEFQEMLPALVSGPSLYFLTFPLHKSLNERFVVEYQYPSGRSIVPFKDSSTVKEVLLQSLASIASTRSYIRVNDGKPVTPKVLLIATHRDKLQSEQQLIEIDKELQEIIEKTAAFKENMIIFYSKDQMVFALDNTSDDDRDIQCVRDAVERIGTRSEEYKIQTPYTWMIFAITLRHLPERVLSIEKCMEIGKECGIKSQQELNDALWFLHHNVGVVRHFQDHPDLQNVVIKEPQYIFDKVTELIVDTFTFEETDPYELQEFTKKGIFPADTIKKLSTESDALTGKEFGDLLEHLHIVAPIKEDGEIVKYFAPAALTHADLPPDTQTEEAIPPVHIVFDSGFCPKGMFGALVVDLLKSNKLSQFEWTLKEDKIYRDQICLSVGPYDSFRFSLSPTYIKITLSTTTDHNRVVCLGHVCCGVRREIESSICNVTEALHYTQRAAHSLAFACPEPPPHDQSHAATINFFQGEPCTLTCPLTKTTHDLPNGGMIWFDESMALPPKACYPTQSTSTNVSSSPSEFPMISSLPIWHHLDLIEGNGKTVRVIERAAAKWNKLATRLYFEPQDISRIRNDVHHQSIDACETVLSEWSQGKGRKPTTWDTIIKALEEADLSELAADLKVMFSAL